MFQFIKTVSDTVLDLINATCYDKPLILSGHISGEARLSSSGKNQLRNFGFLFVAWRCFFFTSL